MAEAIRGPVTRGGTDTLMLLIHEPPRKRPLAELGPKVDSELRTYMNSLRSILTFRRVIDTYAYIY
jgi:hypothetical protein